MPGDIDAGPTVQIRDESYPIQTPSLELAGAEVVPDELVRDLLKKEWIATELAPEPTILVKDEAVQVNLRNRPAIIVEVEDYREEPTGHRHEFAKIEVPIALSIRTVRSRQQLWSLAAEARRIFHEWMLALQPFHVIYFDGFRPDYEGTHNYTGMMRIRLCADAQPIFLRRVTGEESPNTDPGLFPNGI